MYSRAFKRFDDQRHYYHTLGIGASDLAFGLQVLWIVVLLFWSELVILTACMMLTCCVVCNTHLQQRTHCVSLISLLKFLKPILCGQVVADYRRLASFGLLCQTAPYLSSTVLGELALQPGRDARS